MKKYSKRDDLIMAPNLPELYKAVDKQSLIKQVKGARRKLCEELNAIIKRINQI